ncbi:hypothetical protein Tco_1291320 [Tanacetum coccineum]
MLWNLARYPNQEQNVVPKLGSCALAVESLQQWQNFSAVGRFTLTVGKISSSGNHITSSGNALAFYSQHMVVYEKKVYHAFGVDTYDASTKDNFNLRAVVL